MVAAYVALALFLAVFMVVVASRAAYLLSRFRRPDGDDRGRGRRRRPLPPLGGDPYHLP